MKQVKCPVWLAEASVAKMAETIHILEKPILLRAACYEDYNKKIKFYVDIYLPFYIVAIDGVANGKEIESTKINVETACACDCGG